MIARIVNAYRVELAKALRRRFTYLGPALMAAGVACGPAMHPLARDGVSDYAFVAYTTPMVLNLLGLVVLLMYSAGLVASELGNGSICFTLLRPVRRHEYLFAKLLLAMTYSVALAVVVAAASWTLAYAFGDLNGVVWGGNVAYTHVEMLKAYLLGAALAQLPMWTAAAFAIMISTFTASAGAAVAATVGLWVLMDLAKHPLHIASAVFTTYLEAPWRVFINQCDGIGEAWFPSAGYLIATSLVSLAVFTGVAIFALARRDLHT